MQHLLLGQKVALLEQRFQLSIHLTHSSTFIVDAMCFPVDEHEKMLADDYMVFYNQPQSPCRTIALTNNQQSLSRTDIAFNIDLNQSATQVKQYIFALSIDDTQHIAPNFSHIQSLNIQIGSSYRFELSNNHFQNETAIILLKIYQHNGAWKITPVLQGFNDGLAKLVVHYGGTLAEPVEIPNPSPSLSLEKTIEQHFANNHNTNLAAQNQLLSLAKKAELTLTKKQLNHVQAKVALVLDASGSMHQQYTTGKVQEIVNRLLPIAVKFDDNASLDTWAFAQKPLSLGQVHLGNYVDFINKAQAGWKKWRVGARINNEASVIEEVIDFYKNDSNNHLPVYILFISDGGIYNSKKIEKLISQAATLPLFWQFVGLGGSQYGILERLDDLQGRFVDNCDFFALDYLEQYSEEKLYDLMLQEFPSWLKAYRDKTAQQ